MLLSFCKVRCNVDVLSSNCMPKTITESNPNSAAAAYPHTKQAYWRTCKAKKTILQMHSVQPCEETLAFDRRTSTNETIHTSSHVLLTQDIWQKSKSWWSCVRIHRDHRPQVDLQAMHTRHVPPNPQPMPNPQPTPMPAQCNQG